MTSSTVRSGIAAVALIVVATSATLYVGAGRLQDVTPVSTASSTSVPMATPARPVAFAARQRAERALRFEGNLGQAGEDVRFVAHGPDFRAEVLDDGLRLSRRVAPGSKTGAGAAEGVSARLRFVGATAAAFDSREPAAGRTNYLRGSDPAKWLRDVPAWRQLRQAAVYPGIDLVYYGREEALEYDVVVHPGASPSTVRLAVAGAGAPFIEPASGDLLLDGAGGALRMHRPVAYQVIDGQRRPVEARYASRRDGSIAFEVAAYDTGRPLVIDPTFKLLYSTYLGGVHDDQVGAMVVDAQGSSYVVGNSGSEDWPVTGNAYQPTRKQIGSYVRNVVVTKFDASGTVVYSTFLGGTVNDYGQAIAVDAAGNAYVAGYTNSANFPVTGNALQAARQGSQSGFFAVLSSDGSRLSHSSYLGSEAAVRSLVLDGAGAVWLAGQAGPGLPTTAGAYKRTLATSYAPFVAKLTLPPAGPATVVAASYYGVDNPVTNYLSPGTYLHAMKLGPDGTPWFVGQTGTTNLPSTAGALTTAPTGNDLNCTYGAPQLNSFAFIGRLSADLSTLLYSSYVNGKSRVPGDCAEYAYDVAFDSSGVYVTGATASNAHPTTPGAIQVAYPGNSGYYGYASYVTKLKPDGSGILWSTYLGTTNGDTFAGRLAFDPSGALWTAPSTVGGANYPASTADALQAAPAGGYDNSLLKLDAATGALLYASYLGGGGDDWAQALAFDAGGTLHLTGTSGSVNYPTTANAFQPTLTANAYDGADWTHTVLGSGTISRVLPSSGGSGGDVTLALVGVGLQPGATATLAAGGSSIAASGGAVVADGSSATFVFPLVGAANGSYDVVVTNPDGTTIRRPGGFTVAPAGSPVLSAQVLGRPKFRVGVPTTFQVVVSNTGSQQAYAIPLWITVPASATISIDGFSVADTAEMLAWTEGDTTYVNRLILSLAPGESKTVDVHLTTATNGFVPVNAAVQAPWFRTSAAMAAAFGSVDYDSDCVPDAANAAYSNCFGPYQNLAFIGKRGLATGAVLKPEDLRAAADRVRALGDPCKALDHAKEMRDQGRKDGKDDLSHGKGPGDIGSGFNMHVPNPAKDPIGWINYNAGYIQGQSDVFSSAPGGGSGSSPGGAAKVTRQDDSGICPIKPPNPPPSPPPNLPPSGSGGGSGGGAIDPNDKVGPVGDGSASHYIRGDAPLAYQVMFENQPTATLPAAVVVVTDQLDPAKVDLASFELGSIGFGHTTITVPRGLQSYQTVVALSSSVAVRVQGSLDVASGLVKWTFTTLDPVTRLPPSDPTLGFLPPDSDGIVGQGAVNFSVRPRAGLASGTALTNLASIVFDANAAILTPVWTNTIDTTLPSSHVASLAGRVGTMDFDVAWSGADTGSGIGAYDVYVSDNGGAYRRWQTGVKATTAVYPGTSGHSYAFYARASDGAGNAEPAKTAAEATIAVSGAFAAPSTDGGGGGGGCTIGADGDRSDPTLPLAVIAAALLLAIGRRQRGADRNAEAA